MYAVAILELATSLDEEAAALATELGITPYDARLELAAGSPAVVLTTPDRERAARLLGSLRARRHGAVACDTRAVFASEDMIGMRRFRLDPEGIAAEDRPGEVLAYGDVLVLVRATHRRVVETRDQLKTRQFSGSRMLATGGLMSSKNVTQEVVQKSEDREQVLYLFRRGGERPWILHETGTRYTGLGQALGRSQLENFAITVRTLRGRMPTCPFDERLMSVKRLREWSSGSGAASTVAWVDLLAHLIAMSAAGMTSDPYRT